VYASLGFGREECGESSKIVEGNSNMVQEKEASSK